MQTKSIYTMKDLIKNPLRHRSFFLRLGFAISFGLLLLAFRWAEKRKESGREKDEPEEGPLFSPDSNIRNQIGPLDTLEAPPLDVAEVMPSFPGGLTALYAFIRSQIRYPPRERELGIEGTVYLKFVIDRNRPGKQYPDSQSCFAGPQ